MVIVFFFIRTASGTLISCPIPKEKALCIHRKIGDGGENLQQVTVGWSAGRYDTEFAHVTGEKMSADASVTTDFTLKFAEIIETEEF